MMLVDTSVWPATTLASSTKHLMLMFNVRQSFSSFIDVKLFLDAPIVTITASKTTVTEGQDSLLLECQVDANPPATIQWVKNLNLEDEEVIGRI